MCKVANSVVQLTSESCILSCTASRYGGLLGRPTLVGKALSFTHELSLKMQQDVRILKQKSNAAMIALCPGQVW